MRTQERGPPSALAEFFPHTCLQNRLQTDPPTPKKSYPKFQNSTTSLYKILLKLANFAVKLWLNGDPPPPQFFLIVMFLFMLLGSPCKSSEFYDKSF